MNPSEFPTARPGDPETVLDDGETVADLTVAAADADPDSARADHDAGERGDTDLLLGRYRLGRRLGSGAFGLVYRARDERLDRDVAVKVLPRERVVFGRFEREARAAARLQHPAVVTLYEAAVDDEGAYLVSELVRGRTLDVLLAAGELSDRDLLGIGIALCDALAHAHGLGVVHRDVKPSNVLVPSRPEAAGAAAKLTDFGVAQVVGGDALTDPGDVVGTLAYMAPEQAAAGPVGPEADLYALALVLYEALAGVNPGRGRRSDFVPPLARQRRELPRRLTAAIDTALRPRPRERGTVAELRGALQDCFGVADDTPGVVSSGWSGPTLATRAVTDGEDEPGPRWREGAAVAAPEGGDARAPVTILGAGPPPAWLSRALGAAAAGLTVGWVSVHVLHSAPAAPALAALVAALAVLALPRLGWAAIVALLVIFALADGQTGAALVLLAVLGAGVVLLAAAGDGAALCTGSVVLGLVGLAGAWPALVARVCRHAWQRAVVAGVGFLALGAAAGLWHRSLYWSPAHPAAGGGWMASLDQAQHRVLLPLLHPHALLGALVWAAVAAALPLVIRFHRPVRDAVLAIVAAALTVWAVAALGTHELQHAVLGAVVAAAIWSAPALIALGRGLRS